MSVTNIGKDLTRLTYSEMQVFAKLLGKQLNIPHDKIAEALVHLGEHIITVPNTGEEAEIKQLRTAFARKRPVYVQVVNNHFQVTLGTSAMKVAGPSLHGAMSQLLDQIIATQAMGLKP